MVTNIGLNFPKLKGVVDILGVKESQKASGETETFKMMVGQIMVIVKDLDHNLILQYY